MIHSNVNAIPAKCEYSKAMQKAIEWLKNSDFANMDEGKYEIDGEDIYGLVQFKDTAAPSERRAEAHYEYIDVQYMIDGDEDLGYTVMTSKVASCEEHPERDIWFADEEKSENFVHNAPGDFTVFFTNELHRPNCTFADASHNKKAIVKIRESVF